MTSAEAAKIIEHTEKLLRGGGQPHAAQALDIIVAANATGQLHKLLIRMKEWYQEEYAAKFEAKEKVV